ncbi:MAG: GNAT family N-acetyltransferase [Bacilli bacterium]|nr:GNAT family N-acetyltransferase [Bacilli bacterium]
MIKEVSYNDILSLFKGYKEDYIISMSNNSKYYAYELNNSYIGFICILDLDTELEIIDVFVMPEYQGNGYGDKLLKYILDNYRDRNYFLEVNVNNEKAINLYKKNGFDILTTRKHYYKDEDAYVMSKGGEIHE